MKKTFEFSEEQHQIFKDFLNNLNTMNWGTWPPNETWPKFPGLPDYSLAQYETETGMTFTTVKFDHPVLNPFSREQRPTKAWRKGGGRNDQPSYPQF